MTRMFDLEFDLTHAPRRVYGILADPAARLAWSPGLRAMEPLPATPLTTGATWTETRSVFGRDESEQVTVRAAETDRLLVLEVDGSAGTARRGRLTFTWTLTPTDAGTHVRVVGDADDLSRKGAILIRFLAGPFARHTEEEVAGIADLLDARG